MSQQLLNENSKYILEYVSNVYIAHNLNDYNLQYQVCTAVLWYLFLFLVYFLNKQWTLRAWSQFARKYRRGFQSLSILIVSILLFFLNY